MKCVFNFLHRLINKNVLIFLLLLLHVFYSPHTVFSFGNSNLQKATNIKLVVLKNYRKINHTAKKLKLPKPKWSGPKSKKKLVGPVRRLNVV